MASGYKIVAYISKVNGQEPEIEISDPNFKVMKTIDGKICIVHSKKEKYCAIGDAN